MLPEGESSYSGLSYIQRQGVLEQLFEYVKKIAHASADTCTTCLSGIIQVT